MKKCNVTNKQRMGIKERLDQRVNKRCSSAGMFYTSSAGAVTSLIFAGKKDTGAATSLVLISLLSVFFGFFGLTGTTNTYATISTLTLSVTDSVSLNIVSTSSNGTFATTDTSTNNISVKTTNGTGYTLGIKASTNNSNALINTSDSTKTIPSISSSTFPSGVSEANYKDDTYASTNNLNNTWGYRPSKLNSVANSNYLPAPSSSSTITTLDKTTMSNPSTANTYNIALGTRITDTTVQGSYTNTFVITAVVNPTIYSITYNKNTTDTVTNMPSNVTNQETTGETVNISSTVPVRDGYNFKGWCTVQVADGASCSGTTYNPDGGGTNLTWTLNQTVATNSLSIYAMWESSAQPTVLYDAVAAMVKKTNGNPRTQTLADMQAVITKPTSNDPATDTSNSGVYKYNASLFGTASDNNSACTRADGCPIYYYRGILDSNLTDDSGTTCASVGSCGDGAYYPNYVVLSSASNKGSLTTSNTCWRIVRTTGSGGIKMIYNGKWTGSTCANADTSANAVSDVYFNRRSTSSTNNYDTKGRIIYVGYNFSSTSSHQTDTSSVANSTLFVNDTASNLRTQLESWYASNMTSYTSKLETNAGWCSDRTTYDSSYTSTSSNVPYKTSSATVYFGADKRNVRSGKSEKLSLTCTNTADRLTTSNGMTYPAAPLTADEAALAGSGYGGRTSTTTASSNYHYNSYLRSGGYFWLLSPYYRLSSGSVLGFTLNSYGYLFNSFTSDADGVRPSISLNPGTSSVNGSGTATDPWIINP